MESTLRRSLAVWVSLEAALSQHETRRIVTPYATRREVTRGAVAMLRP